MKRTPKYVGLDVHQATTVTEVLEPAALRQNRARVVERTGCDVSLMTIESDGDHASSRG